MKRTFHNKVIFSAVCASLIFPAAFADDFDSFDGFSDFQDFSEQGAAQKTVSVTGTASAGARAYVDNSDSAGDAGIDAVPKASLGFSYDGKKVDAKLNIKLTEDIILNHPFDVADEISLGGYFGAFSFEAGKLKTVWGKGDKLHVIDNFNADDYTDFIVPEYIDRRVATPMIKLGVDFPAANLHLEGIYTPLLPVDRFAKNGVWKPDAVSALENGVRAAAEKQVAKSFSEYNAALLQVASGNSAALPALQTAAAKYMTELTNANALNSNPDSVYPDLKTLKYGQFGARLTGTAGPVDFGVSYYDGYFKQPSVNAAKMNAWVEKTLSGTAAEDDKFLSYDKKRTFGVEAAFALWHFNVRAEAAYNLTEDTDGTDPYVHNNSVAWLGGFDIDMPFWNMNINIQETGSYILNSSECEKNAADVDYNSDGLYSKNKIVLNITAAFIHDKLVPEVTLVYGIEGSDIAVLPKVTFKITDNFSVSADGLYIWNNNSSGEFYSWRNNSFVNLGVQCQF